MFAERVDRHSDPLLEAGARGVHRKAHHRVLGREVVLDHAGGHASLSGDAA
jgi:hypothetical protein